MALPIREEIAESTRQVRVTEIRFDASKDDRVIFANIDFELKHRDADNTIDESWAIAEINPAQKEQLSRISSDDWLTCTVQLKPLSNGFCEVSMCITNIFLACAWIEPERVTRSSRELNR